MADSLPDRCAACGTPFRCGMQAGDTRCWCADLPAVIPAPGRSCLCRACLELEVAAQAKQQPPAG